MEKDLCRRLLFLPLEDVCVPVGRLNRLAGTMLLSKHVGGCGNDRASVRLICLFIVVCIIVFATLDMAVIHYNTGMCTGFLHVSFLMSVETRPKVY